MPVLNLKPNHKVIKEYFAGLAQLGEKDIRNEGAVAPLFANVLRYCARQRKWTLATEHSSGRLRFDGELLDDFNLRHGVWEAKDTADDLAEEAKSKFRKGYPKKSD